MEIKTDVRVSLDLHFTSDDLANSRELAQLAAVCDGLYLLLKAGGHEVPSVEGVRTVPAIAAAETQAGPAESEESAPDPSETDKPRRRQMPASRNWSFEEFDAAVRAEMQRLGDHGKMPTTALWDRERSPDLPSLTGVMRRYGCKNTAELAHELGCQPAGVRPGPAPAVASPNGAAGRHL